MFQVFCVLNLINNFVISLIILPFNVDVFCIPAARLQPVIHSHVQVTIATVKRLPLH